jgi:hypothetical protein
VPKFVVGAANVAKIVFEHQENFSQRIHRSVDFIHIVLFKPGKIAQINSLEQPEKQVSQTIRKSVVVLHIVFISSDLLVLKSFGIQREVSSGLQICRPLTFHVSMVAKKVSLRLILGGQADCSLFLPPVAHECLAQTDGVTS